MGIPGLASQLHKYGSYTTMQQTKAQTGQQTAAIIDGPSLAHSLYRLGKYEVAKDGTVSQYDYEAVGKAAVAWLDKLRSYGFEIEGIYFDGALPAYKKQTRLDRVQGYVNKLFNYRQVHAQATKSLRVRGHSPTDDRVARGPGLQKARDALPPPPFLVFAVVEALFASNYADRTWLVDGEADAYCAAAASEASTHHPGHGIVVFTNDSDLVIFKFNAPIRITMINEVKETGNPAGNRLEMYEFHPATISVQGEVPDLVACAYYMREHQASLAEAIRKHHPLERNSTQYKDFLKMYDVTHWTRRLQQLQESRQLGKVALCLDSRISEPIYQAARNGTTSTSDDFDPISTVHDSNAHLDLFLPVLFEDTTRSSAWRIGWSFREVAEQLILHSSPTATSLLEYRRSGTRIAPVQVDRTSIDDLNSKLSALTARFRGLQSMATYSTSDIFFPQLVVAIAALQDIAEQAATTPSIEDVVAVLIGGSLTTWELVHLSAQFQAQYYSIRMLKQVLHWWESQLRQETQVVVPRELRQQLRTLPGIAEFFSQSNNGELSIAELRKILEEVLMQVDAPVLRKKCSAKGRRRRNKEGENEEIEPPRKRADLMSNPFALLDESGDS